MEETREYGRVSIEKQSDGDASDDETYNDPRGGLISGVLKPRYSMRSLWKPNGRKLLKKGLWVISAIGLLGTYLAMFFVGRYSWSEKDIDSECFYRTTPWSPVLDFMDPTPKLTQFNGTLGYPSEFTGDPSPELDAVWHKWSYVNYASIPEEEFKQLPGAEAFPDAAKLTDSYGGGYIGFLEFSHHMHCLNMLRQGIRQDYYNNPEKPEQMAEIFSDRPHTVHVHLQHCIEILRQNVMCNADVGIIPHQWITATPDPFANFNTFHKCRDLDAVTQWIDTHQIPNPPDGSDLPIPLGSKIFARPP